MFKKIDSKMNFPKMEEEVLKFWEENKTFQKSIENRKDAPDYSFYDGPPFATGTPHYGHIVASTMKDVVPRYWTMRGYRVERKWGWDCHGLPIENIVEKELGSKAKKDIEALGVEKFNALCRSKVLGYVEEWRKIIGRLGRWADMDNAYRTMDLDFMESVWWVFKELYDKGLIYEDYRSMHICPRCETTLSQSEVAEGYKMVKDLSATVKFELVETQNFASLQGGDNQKTYILAWTTTPWTLIGNVALAVGKDIEYLKVAKLKVLSSDEEFLDFNTAQIEEVYYISKDIFLKKTHLVVDNVYNWVENNNNLGTYQIIDSVKGKDLVGKLYKPLFDYYSKDENLKNRENGWKIYAGDFVTTEEGTGVVHIAPAFGEDDMNLGKKYNLPFVQHVGMDGVIKKEAGEFAGLHVKPLENTQATDVEIIKYLAHNGLLFAKEKYEHSYPHCWRCDTPLLNYATSSWFVKVTEIKGDALEFAKEINWFPHHMKEGRFGNWLEGARDWSISRQRFWASVIPVWRCENCKEIKVIGSVKELEELSGQKVEDLHKDVVDKITFQCDKCPSTLRQAQDSGQENTMKRIPDVLDTWFDSGSMPYAQMHYPFENKEKFEKSFPANFIAEGVDQTRAWFYYLHVIASSIKKSIAFQNVIVNGIVLAEDGKKMAKKLKNYPDPALMFDKYGADAMRFYLLSSPVMAAENLNFKEADITELVRGMFRMLWNSYSFFVLYANIDKYESRNLQLETRNLLDKWMISELQILTKNVNQAMEEYNLPKAVRYFPPFIDNLSNWYIRRSRKRFWKSEDDGDKKEAYDTLYYVLRELAKLMAPFTPFIAEEIFKNLTGKESVHLEDFPAVDNSLIDFDINVKMALVRAIVNDALANRAKAGLKVRQPLASVTIGHRLNNELIEIIKEEINVKEVNVVPKDNAPVAELDLEITPELKLEGVAREVVRFIQEMRKEAGYEVDNRIQVGYDTTSSVFSEFGDMIKKETLANELKQVKIENADLEKEFIIEDEKILITIKKA